MSSLAREQRPKGPQHHDQTLGHTRCASRRGYQAPASRTAKQPTRRAEPPVGGQTLSLKLATPQYRAVRRHGRTFQTEVLKGWMERNNSLHYLLATRTW